MSFAELRKLRKKLRQIEKLERTDRELTEEELAKVNSKHDIRQLLQQLATGSADELSTSVWKEKSPSTSGSYTGSGEESTPELATMKRVSDSAAECEIEVKKPTKQQKQGVSSLTTPTMPSKDAVKLDCDASPQIPQTRNVNETPSSTSLSDSNPAKLDHTPVNPAKPPGGNCKSKNKLEHSCTFIVQQLHGHNGAVRSMSLVDDFLVTGSQDTTVKVWSISSGSELRSLGGHTQPVSGVLVLSSTSSIHLAKQLREADEDGDLATCLSHDESEGDYYLIISIALDSTIRIWCLWSGVCVKSIYTFHPLTGLSFIDSKLLVVCGSDGGKLEVWDPVKSSGPMESLLAHEDAITSVTVDAEYVYCSSADGLLNIFEWSEGHLRHLFESTDAKSSTGSLICHRRIHCIAVSNGIAYYGDDGMNVKALNWKTGVVNKLPNHTTEFGSTHGLCVSNDCLIASGYDLDNGVGYINVRSVQDGRYLYTLCDVQTGYIQCVVCSSMNNGRLAIVTGGQELKTWMPAGNDCPTPRIQISNNHDIAREIVHYSSPGEVIKSIYVSRFDKEARHSDSESDSDADDSDSSSSSSESLPWHQSEPIEARTGWLSWCSLL